MSSGMINVPVFIVRQDPILQKIDEVDNIIHYAVSEMVGRTIEWDAEFLGEVRDAILSVLESEGFDRNEIYPNYEED